MLVGITRRPNGCDSPSGITLLDTQPIDMTVLLEIPTGSSGTAILRAA
jgi:hypothetical protein